MRLLLSRASSLPFLDCTESRRTGRIDKLCKEDETLQALYAVGDRNGAVVRVLARRIGEDGVFASAEAEAMGQAQEDGRAAGPAVFL